MGLTVRSVLVLALMVGLVACGETPTQPSPPPPPPPPPPSPLLVFVDHKAGFDNAVRELGTLTLIDFEDIDASPISDTISGRPSFDGLRYVGRGLQVSNPNAVPLFIAPAGLFWNPTNSLSVGRFPFDPLDQAVEAPFIEDDDLVVTFEPGCLAAAFSVIDKGERSVDDFIQFLDAEGQVIQRAAFPQAFLGIVSRVRAVIRISISEAAGDSDDVTYDDFVCVR